MLSRVCYDSGIRFQQTLEFSGCLHAFGGKIMHFNLYVGNSKMPTRGSEDYLLPCIFLTYI